MAEALSGCLQLFLWLQTDVCGVSHLTSVNYPLQQRDVNVRGLPPQAVLCTLDFDGTVLYLYGSCDIAGHHAPHKAGQFPGNRCFCHVGFLAA